MFIAICKQLNKISKLQLIIALYVDYIWLIVFILTSYTILIATRSFCDEKKTDMT